MSKYYRHTNELVLLMPIMFRWVPKIEHFEVQLCIFSTKGTVPRILFVIILIDNVTHRFLTCLGERLNETLNIFKIWKNIHSFSISFLKTFENKYVYFRVSIAHLEPPWPKRGFQQNIPQLAQWCVYIQQFVLLLKVSRCDFAFVAKLCQAFLEKNCNNHILLA